MAFKPYTYYASKLPVLKPGHFLKIGEEYFVVKAKKRARVIIDLGTSTYDKKGLHEISENNDLLGNKDLGKIVHIQYLACDTDVDVYLELAGKSLFGEEYRVPVNSNVAPTDCPIEIDKWFYDKSRYIKLTKSSTSSQKLYIEYILYLVEKAPTVPSKYLKLTTEGEAIFIER